MNPAALKALLNGDLENAIIASTPGGIEAQEAAGQRSFVNSETLPKDMRPEDRAALEAVGAVFGNDKDDLFVNVTLPVGWSKRATDHSMWSELVDDKDRKRANIFYKAAFYDRSAHMSMSRYYNASANFDGERYVFVTDGDGNEVYRTESIGVRPDNQDEMRQWYTRADELEIQVRLWLDMNYPDWRNPAAYW